VRLNGKVYVNDIVGRHFGDLIVSEYVGYWNKRHHYRCECACGKEKVILRSSLVHGRSHSCGECKEPHIEKENGYYRYYCTNGESFIFDEVDLPMLSMMSCNISKKGYVSFNRKKCLLTHLLLGVEDDVVVDHINGDPFDNRRSNLRVAHGNQNKWNYSLSVRNTSGYKGVCWDKRMGGYRASVCKDGKKHFLGIFNTPEEAARAYDEAARFYFGEFACVNFPRPGEQGCRRNQPTEEQEERKTA